MRNRKVGSLKKQVALLEARARKRSRLQALSRRTVNQIALDIASDQKDFLWTAEWRALRQTVLAHYGSTCMRCGGSPPPQHVHVDHIKPRRHFPDLALVFENLQVLCAVCNKNKGNKHYTDYRPKAALQSKA